MQKAQRVAFFVDQSTWCEFRIKALRNKQSASQALAELVQRYVEDGEEKNTEQSETTSG